MGALSLAVFNIILESHSGQTASIGPSPTIFDPLTTGICELPDAGTIGPLAIAERLFPPRQGREGPADTFLLVLVLPPPIVSACQVANLILASIDRPNGNLAS